jgi:hypothetical protein
MRIMSQFGEYDDRPFCQPTPVARVIFSVILNPSDSPWPVQGRPSNLVAAIRLLLAVFEECDGSREIEQQPPHGLRILEQSVRAPRAVSLWRATGAEGQS